MKNKYKVLIVILVLILAFLIGTFTSPVVREIITNNSSHDKTFQLFYSDVLVNGIKDTSVIEDKNTISFTTTLQNKGETYVLDYEVKNSSKNYSAEVKVTCTEGNDYVKVNNQFDTTKEMEPLEVRNGKLTLELIKTNADKEDKTFKVKCTIVEDAKEK